jgi:hypothetical protein
MDCSALSSCTIQEISSGQDALEGSAAHAVDCFEQLSKIDEKECWAVLIVIVLALSLAVGILVLNLYLQSH